MECITIADFNRAPSVYQILLGPEVAELCMFFGYLARGDIERTVAGLDFTLLGFLLILLGDYPHTIVGFRNAYVNASFPALQPIVTAMVNPPCLPTYQTIYHLD